MRDFEIRQVLKRTELSGYLTDGTSKVVEELNLWTTGARIDIAVINGNLHGYEIKSASDTLQRLPNQLEAYGKIFDYLSVVTENKHYGKVYELLPKWVGLYVCNEKSINSIVEIRPPTFNSNKSGFHLAKLLWRDELISVLTEHNISFRKRDRNWILCEVLSDKIEMLKLSDIVRSKLKCRVNWKEGFIARFEESSCDDFDLSAPKSLDSPDVD